MTLRSEASLFSALILVSLGLIVGILSVSYISALIVNYRNQVELFNLVQEEASKTIVNLVMYDDTLDTVWLLFRRTDGSPGGFYVIINADQTYLNCSSIQVYNPLMDTDGIMCNEQGECAPATLVYRGRMSNVFVPLGGSIETLETYARLRGMPVANEIQACRITSVCELKGIRGMCFDNTIVRVVFPTDIGKLRVLTSILLGDDVYVVDVYEVSMK